MTLTSGDYHFYPNSGTSWVNPTPVVHNHYVNMQGLEDILARFNRVTFLLNELAARLDAIEEKLDR